MSTFHSKSLKGFEKLAQNIEHFTCDWLFLIQTRHNQSQWSESDRIAASASSKTHHNTVFNDLIRSVNHIACRHWTNRCNFTKLVNFTRNISVDHARRTSVRFKSPHKSNNACPSQRFFTPLSYVFVRVDFKLLRNFLSCTIFFLLPARTINNTIYINKSNKHR